MWLGIISLEICLCEIWELPTFIIFNHTIIHKIIEEIVEEDEAYRPIKFYDVGAFVWFAHIIEWEFPGFSVDECFEHLLKMQEKIEKLKNIIVPHWHHSCQVHPLYRTISLLEQ